MGKEEKEGLAATTALRGQGGSSRHLGIKHSRQGLVGLPVRWVCGVLGKTRRVGPVDMSL